jgi:hypothetical protein
MRPERVLPFSVCQGSSPSKLCINVWLPAATLLDELDLTEFTQAAQWIKNASLGDGEKLGLVDEPGERPGCEKALVVPERLPDDFHHALLPVPFPVSFEGICGQRD